MAEEAQDESLLNEMESTVNELEIKLASAEVKAILSGESDFNNAIVSINSGAGGTESQDWAQMLLRMYTRWGERNGYETEISDIQYGEEAGIKSATVIFSGDVDINMRGQLQGFKCIYLPEAKVYHIGTATVGLYSDRYIYLCKRNDIFVLIRNYSLRMYFRYLWTILKHQFNDIKYFTYRGQGIVLFKSKLDAFKMLPSMLFRRFRIQSSRSVPDSKIDPLIIKS